MSLSNLNPGALIKDRYEIMAELGEGGFARVFRARDNELGRTVALKILKMGPNGGSESERFRREARLLGQLQHPNIVSVYSIDLLDDAPMIVMEFLSGKSLQQVLLEQKSLDHQSCQAIFAQICSGLSYAHKQGVVHRDLSPGNIFLLDESTAHVKIIDFGLARLVADGENKSLTITQTGALVGNPAYMSPEQSRGDKLDERSDVYSVGCMLYQCMTGRTPFEAWNPIAILHQQQNEYPATPTSNWTDKIIESKFQQIVLRCLQKEKSKRFGSTEEVKAALLEDAEKVKALAKLDDWGDVSRKQPKFPASMALLLLVTVGVILGSLFFFGSDLAVALLKPVQSDSLSGMKEWVADKISQRSPLQAAELYSELLESAKKRGDCETLRRVSIDLLDCQRRTGMSSSQLDLIDTAVRCNSKQKSGEEEFLRRVQSLLDSICTSQVSTVTELRLRCRILEKLLKSSAKKSSIRPVLDTLLLRSALPGNKIEFASDDEYQTVMIETIRATVHTLEKLSLRTNESEDDLLIRLTSASLNYVSTPPKHSLRTKKAIELIDSQIALVKVLIPVTSVDTIRSELQVNLVEHLRSRDLKAAFEQGQKILKSSDGPSPPNRLNLLLRMTAICVDSGLDNPEKYFSEAEQVLNTEIASSPFDTFYWGTYLYYQEWATLGREACEKRHTLQKMEALFSKTENLAQSGGLLFTDSNSRLKSGASRMNDQRTHNAFLAACETFVRAGAYQSANKFLKRYKQLLEATGEPAADARRLKSLEQNPDIPSSTRSLLQKILEINT